MKKIICLLFGIIIVTMTFAQTQQGIVKTRGRMVNGQVVPGTRLTGATITLNFGNPLVSGDDGAFSFNVPTSKNYSLVTAKKQGYTLADPEYTHRSFAYSSSNPFYVVLEDEAQRQADINAATRKVRRTLTTQLQAREEEIEVLKEQNKLTEAEYQRRLQELYDNQSKSEQLVKEMAERYASTDYDQLDEFNRQVQMYIEEGELQKADSMIRSKGDMEQRVAEYHNVVTANQKARQQLEQSEAGAAKTYEDLAQDLLRRSEIFLQSFQQDSALYYLKMRADLDSTNIYAVVVYAEVCRRQKAFFEAEKYFNICLKICQSENEEGRVALLLEYLGSLYNDMHDYYKSLEYYCRASDAFENLSRSYPDRFQGELASVQKELAIVYREIQDYPNAEKSLKLALRNYELLDLQNQNAYRAEIAAVFSEFGNLYLQLKDYIQSEHYYKSSLENYTLLFQQDPDTYISSLAEVEANLGILYKDIHNYDKSTEFELSALAKYENLFALNPDAYRELVRSIQLNLGVLYMELKEFTSSLKYTELSLENAKILFQKYNEVYRKDLAASLNNLGMLYWTINDIGKAITFFQSALDNYEVLYKQFPNVYIDQIALIQQNLGAAYFKQFDFDLAEYYLKLAFDNTTKMSDQNTQAYRISMADIQTDLGLTSLLSNKRTKFVNVNS